MSVEGLFIEYSAGGLSAAARTLVATHLGLRPRARARVAELEALGGAIMDATPVSTLSEDALDAVLARIGAEPVAEPAANDRATYANGLPAPLGRLVDPPKDRRDWRRVSAGVYKWPVEALTDASSEAWLFSIDPGCTIPAHTHEGQEITLVLEGAFEDHTGRYGPGDIEVGDGRLEHTPKVIGSEPCLCLAVVDGAMRFRNPFVDAAVRLFG